MYHIQVGQLNPEVTTYWRPKKPSGDVTLIVPFFFSFQIATGMALAISPNFTSNLSAQRMP
jgi:hypothetical protein